MNILSPPQQTAKITFSNISLVTENIEMANKQFLKLKLFSIVSWKPYKLLETVKAVVQIVKTIFTENACIILNWIQNGAWLNLAKEIIFSLKTLKISLSLISLSQNSYSKRTTVNWHLKNKNK